MNTVPNRRYANSIISMSLLLISCASQAFDLKIGSLRTTISRPETSHSLIYQSENETKTIFNLSPVNNERIGLFLDVNGIEIGYAVDVLGNDIETKTQNLLFSYRKLKHSKVTFNFQVLEGLETEAEKLTDGFEDKRFLTNSKSTKLELFGQHNLHTFAGKESLFEHFFLNRPHLSNRFEYSVSLVGGWSLKRLELENPTNIVFDPQFLAQPVASVSRLKSSSISANLGPLLSMSFSNNISAFVEYKYGVGYIRSNANRSKLKQSGDEKASAFGAGVSWTSKDKKSLILFRAWEQEGRHIKTTFGDLSFVRFF